MGSHTESSRSAIRVISTLSCFLLFSFLLVSTVLTQEGSVFDVSSDGGCLKCGEDCLPAVQESLPSCLAPALAAAGAFIGVPVPDLGITGSVMDCLSVTLSTSEPRTARTVTARES